MAQAGRLEPDEDLAGSRLVQVQLGDLPRLAALAEHRRPGLHASSGLGSAWLGARVKGAVFSFHITRFSSSKVSYIVCPEPGGALMTGTASAGPRLWPTPGLEGARGAPARQARRGAAVDISLDGKVALVTGAGPNIGSGIALALSRYGARVACNDLRARGGQGGRAADRAQRRDRRGAVRRRELRGRRAWRTSAAVLQTLGPHRHRRQQRGGPARPRHPGGGSGLVQPGGDRGRGRQLPATPSTPRSR